MGLCSVSDETIPDAERDLPRNLCPLIKSSYGFAKTDKCPFFYFSKAEATKELNAVAEKIEAEYAEGTMQPKKPRILIIGCSMGGVTTKVLKAVEDNGGIVVAFENCSGTKSFDRLVREDGDPYDALAERYLSIGCSVMSPNSNRYELLGRLVREYQVDGVVEMTLSAYHTYAIEAKSIERYVNDECGIPYLQVETDYSTTDTGQLNTRVAAFIEML